MPSAPGQCSRRGAIVKLDDRVKKIAHVLLQVSWPGQSALVAPAQTSSSWQDGMIEWLDANRLDLVGMDLFSRELGGKPTKYGREESICYVSYIRRGVIKSEKAL